MTTACSYLVAPNAEDSGLYYTAGTCNTNPAKFNCFGSKNECEGESWLTDSGFKTSGEVTCAKKTHGGRKWSYTRGYKNAGVTAAVFSMQGSIGEATWLDV
jgi:hypothetical protein